MSSTIFLFLWLISCSLTAALEREFTVNIEPRKHDCFYQNVSKDQTIEVEYQVIDGGHGDLDIKFNVINPHGRVLISDEKISENVHKIVASDEGDYKFCFDNTFSAFNTKTVFFEIMIHGSHDDIWSEDNDMNYDAIKSDETYDITVQEIQEALTNVKNHLNSVIRIQDTIKSSEARDRNIAEENFFIVNTFSCLQVVVMLVAGLMQVYLIRNLFNTAPKTKGFW